MALNIAHSALLGPVIGLNAWTFVMEVWMYAQRLPGISKATKEGKLKVDAFMTRDELDKALPTNARWSADNFNHLFEQPTQFYAVALSLALMGEDGGVNVKLAWAYVGLRVVHSFVQTSGVDLMKRFQVFALSSAIVAAMTVRAAIVLLK